MAFCFGWAFFAYLDSDSECGSTGPIEFGPIRIRNSASHIWYLNPPYAYPELSAVPHVTNCSIVARMSGEAGPFSGFRVFLCMAANKKSSFARQVVSPKKINIKIRYQEELPLHLYFTTKMLRRRAMTAYLAMPP
jgi:hypothetical protein